MIRPLRLLRILLNRVFAYAHVRRGVHLFRRGKFMRAGAHIHTGLLLGGPSFTAHLYLGRIYLRLSRFERARHEFAQARLIDPGRFAAQGLPEDVLLELAERPWPARDERERVPRESDRTRAPLAPLGSSRSIADDFCSNSERERFRVLPPIRREDIDQLDWRDANSLFD